MVGFSVAHLVHGVGWEMSTPCLAVTEKTGKDTSPVCLNQEQIGTVKVLSAVMANEFLLLFGHPYRNKMLQQKHLVKCNLKGFFKCENKSLSHLHFECFF